SARVSPDDAIAIIRIVHLVVTADHREDDDELAMLDSVTIGLCELAGIEVDAVPPSSDSLPSDDERLERVCGLGDQLSSKASRELAYAIAYLLSISDLDLAPAEAALIDGLAGALGIPDDRSEALAAGVAAAVTPHP